MNKYIQTLTNSRGDVLPGERLQVVTSAGAAVDIYADNNETRFTDDDGSPVNYATADLDGLVEFYWVPESGQVLQWLDARGSLRRAYTDFAKPYLLSEFGGEVAQAQVTGLVDDLAAKATTAALASTDTGKGAAMVGYMPGGTGAEASTAESKLRRFLDALDYIPEELHAGIRDGSNTTPLGQYVSKATTEANATGGGEVWLPRGTYLCTDVTGTVGLPGDDGTVKEGYGTEMDPETVESMPYSIRTYPNVTLVGDGPTATVITGDWSNTTGDVDTSQIIGICEASTSTGFVSRAYFRNMTISNFMIGIMTRTILVSHVYDNLIFTGCGIPILGPSSEQSVFRKITMSNCVAGITLGGWWLQRNDSYAAANLSYMWSQGYVDKDIREDIRWQNSIGYNSVAADLDEFFDTYFYKTANNTTRLSDPIDNVTGNAPYIGITGMGYCVMSRYGRPTFNNTTWLNFVYGGWRCATVDSIPSGLTYGAFYHERIGFEDPTNYTTSDKFGIDTTDPYLVGTHATIRGNDLTGSARNSFEQGSMFPICTAVAIPTHSETSWVNISAVTTHGTAALPGSYNYVPRVMVGSRMTFGTTEDTASLVNATGSGSLTGTAQIGFNLRMSPAGATGSFIGYNSAPTITDFTAGAVFGYVAANPVKTGTGAVTSCYGYRVADLTAGGSANYGFHALVSAGAGKWAAYMGGTANSYFGGPVAIKSSGAAPRFDLDIHGTLCIRPGASVAPIAIGDVVVEATNDTTLTFKFRGSDGTTRSGTVALS